MGSSTRLPVNRIFKDVLKGATWVIIRMVILVWLVLSEWSPILTNAASSPKRKDQAYQINPKPCWVDGQEGTCMFVYECIKTEGYHIGMCVDTFMFGSCCAHNSTQNTLLPPQQQHHSNKPQILYTHSSSSPSQSQNSHSNNYNKPTKPLSHYISTSRPKPNRIFYSHQQASNSTRSSLATPSPTLATSTNQKPDHSWRISTPPPRHSIRPMNTEDEFTLQANLIYTKPGWQMTTEPAFITSNHSTQQGEVSGLLNWQLTTESSIITKQKKPTKTKNKPTKKPVQSVPDKYFTKYSFKPTKPTTTKRPEALRPQLITSLSEKVTPMPTQVPSSTSGGVTMSTTSAASVDIPCGVPQMFTKPQTRIVGGKNAPFGRWPWQVSVRRTSFFGFSSTHRCGGAVLNENWMATAGHCVDDLLTSQIRIRVGEYDFSNIQEQLPYVERGVSQKIVHPKYNYFTYEYDLALVQVDKPLEFLPHISPICLPASNDLLIGENATVTGWGRLSEGGTLPSVLQEVQVPIVSNDRCKSMFLRAGRHEFIPDIFLCAGYEGGGQDSCQGDSGGPLQVKGKDGKYFLAGIISWGIGCAEANLPGVCTRISKFVPWILKIVT
ncbi:serine proteinase stubble isoform X1 [Diabrotica virgifera virgifera]|uniref:Peptidase S1 domain-containing protein n=1 Tax=Diabrotica virgifera virgifera TaxID=50390 RepID=A0ABM5JU64_DIAVI|nr:serine proteinase stubble isoform X1 [Diabrotica virgifera virgifera]